MVEAAVILQISKLQAPSACQTLKTPLQIWPAIVRQMPPPHQIRLVQVQLPVTMRTPQLMTKTV